MKTLIHVLPLLFLSCTAFAQDNPGRADYARVEETLNSWDAVRGPWLSQSLSAMADNKSIPTRNFPERFTPHQMLTMVPLETRQEIQRISNDARQNRGDQAFWTDITRYVSAPNCQSSSGRTYGDPHLISYDGARNSFQTVGEFVLTKSSNGDMEVQTRQKAMGDDFSLNTAVAMNVSGDRVCLYTRDYPDGDYSTPLRLDGRPLRLDGGTYMLENGGTIKKVGNDYTVYWPSGESVTAQMRNSGNMEFMDISVNVHDCNEGQYDGLLGNANGSTRDDYSSAGLAPVVWDNDDDYTNRKRQEYMAKDFAEYHRITQASSLFDYIIGMNTMTYTDRSFPRVYRDFSDINDSRMNRSRRHCEELNIDPRDMQGCIYDNAYLGIDGSPAPVTPDPVKGTVLRPVTGRLENPNPQRPDSQAGSGNVPDVRETPTGSTGRTIENNDAEIRTPRPDTRVEPRTEPRVEPRPEPTPQPRIEPRPQPTPQPRVEPAPPRPNPTPAPRPNPTPPPPKTPTPAPRGGGK